MGPLGISLLMASVSPDYAYSFGGWTSVKDGTSCGAIATFERGTQLIVRRDFAKPELGVAMIVANPNWSVVHGKTYQRVKINFDNYRIFNGVALGLSDGESRGLVVKFPVKFLDDIQFARTLEITIGGKFIDRLDVDGIGSAARSTNSCIDKQRAQKAEEDRQKAVDEFPADPFADDK